jgi:hypothetical protein
MYILGHLIWSSHMLTLSQRKPTRWMKLERNDSLPESRMGCGSGSTHRTSVLPCHRHRTIGVPACLLPTYVWCSIDRRRRLGRSSKHPWKYLALLSWGTIIPGEVFALSSRKTMKVRSRSAAASAPAKTVWAAGRIDVWLDPRCLKFWTSCSLRYTLNTEETSVLPMECCFRVGEPKEHCWEEVTWTRNISERTGKARALGLGMDASFGRAKEAH